MFHEANAQKGGIITREIDPVYSPRSIDSLVMVMGHIYVATPYNKVPLSGVRPQTKYEEVDIGQMPADFIPSSIYRPGNLEGELSKFYTKIPSINDSNKNTKQINRFYRYANRRRSQPDDTRTLISAIIPPGVTHIDNIFSITFENSATMVAFTGSTHSICFDFLIKISGKDNMRHDLIGKLP